MSAPHTASGVRRVVEVGGLSKAALLARLRAADVSLNPLAQALFDDPRFFTEPSPRRIDTLELSVADLGLPQGGTFHALCLAAAAQGLSCCPLALGPHLRLQTLDQPEGALGHPPTRHCAPPGSLTVASAPLDDDDDTPKGFYLRRIDGALWLRAWRSGPDHLWSPTDHLLFALPPT